MDIIQVGLWLGRHLSLSAGHKLARFVSGAIAILQNSDLLLAIKANQWIVSGETLDKKGLNQRAKLVLQNDLISLFDYFYYYQRVDECLQRLQLSPTLQTMLKEATEHQKPQILLGPHLSNFDLMGLMIVKLGLPVVILSYPNPNRTYQAQNKLREDAGMRILPISLSTFREAKHALKAGYCVVTGIDRPVDTSENAKYQPKFFGRPSRLSTYYVRMAKDTGASVRVGYGITQPDQSFYIDFSEPIVFEDYPDLQEEYVLNAEKVLKETEKIILRYPEQWSMFYPIWPEVLPKIKQLP